MVAIVDIQVARDPEASAGSAGRYAAARSRAGRIADPRRGRRRRTAALGHRLIGRGRSGLAPYTRGGISPAPLRAEVVAPADHGFGAERPYLAAEDLILISEIGRASCRERVCQYV